MVLGRRLSACLSIRVSIHAYLIGAQTMSSAKILAAGGTVWRGQQERNNNNSNNNNCNNTLGL